METFEIMFGDLTQDAQESLLKFLGYSDESDGNFEVSPLAIIYREESLED